MKNKIFRKSLAFVIVVLFVGAGVVSAFNVNPVNESKPVNRGNENDKDNSIYSSLKEDSKNNGPQPKWDIIIGPYLYVWIKANLSTKEFRDIYYYQDDHRLSMYIEFLAEDANDDSYFTYNYLLSPFKGIIFDHKENNRYNYYWIQFDIVFKKIVKYSNDRILISLSGLFGMVAWTGLGIPTHDTSRPTVPAIIGPFQGKPNVEYNYTFFSRSYNESDLFYNIDWGDGNSTGWIGPYKSCEAFTLTHLWDTKGIYEITAQSKDIFGTQSKLNNITVKISKWTSEEFYYAKSLLVKPKVTMSKNLQ